MSELLQKSLVVKVFEAGKDYDAQRDGPRRSLCIEKDESGILWTAKWTNSLPSDTYWTCRGAPGADENQALSSLLRRLVEETARDTGKFRSIR